MIYIDAGLRQCLKSLAVQAGEESSSFTIFFVFHFFSLRATMTLIHFPCLLSCILSLTSLSTASSRRFAPDTDTLEHSSPAQLYRRQDPATNAAAASPAVASPSAAASDAATQDAAANATDPEAEYRFISVITDKSVTPIQIDPSTGNYTVQINPALHFSATASNDQVRVRLVTDLTRGTNFGEDLFGSLVVELMDFGPNNITTVSMGLVLSHLVVC